MITPERLVPRRIVDLLPVWQSVVLSNLGESVSSSNDMKPSVGATYFNSSVCARSDLLTWR